MKPEQPTIPDELNNYLRKNYYEVQERDMRNWINALENNPEVSKEEVYIRVKRMLLDWTTIYVHGANLATVILERDKLLSEKKESRALLEKATKILDCEYVFMSKETGKPCGCCEVCTLKRAITTFLEGEKP